MFDDGSAFGQSYGFFEGRADGLDDPSGAADFASSASTVRLYEDVGPVVIEGLLFAVGVVVDVDVVVEDVVVYFVWIGVGFSVCPGYGVVSGVVVDSAYFVPGVESLGNSEEGGAEARVVVDCMSVEDFLEALAVGS